MQHRAIGPFLLAIGVGFAAGALFAATLLHRGETPRMESPSASVALVGAKPTTGAMPRQGDGQLASILGDSDPLRRTEALLKYVQSIPTDKLTEVVGQTQTDNDQALTLMVERWNELDPAGAEAAIPNLKNRKARYLLINAVYARLAAEDPVSAMQSAQQLPGQLRDSASQAVIEEVAKEDPNAALKMFQDAKNVNVSALKAVFERWADRDLGTATQAALKLSRPGDRNYMVQSIALRLSSKDPAGALDWLDGLQESQQDHTRAQIIGDWANSDPQAAADYFQRLPTPAASWGPIMAQNICRIWAQSDPQAAATWAQTLKGDQRNAGLDSAMLEWCRDDPKSAVAFWGTLSSNPSTQIYLVHGIASIWTQTDGEAALNWANQLPSGPVKKEALTSVLMNWATVEPTRAIAATEAVQDSATRDYAIGEIAEGWAQRDPAASAPWIATLPESPKKGEILGMLTHAWAQSDPSSASNWLTQLPAGANRDNAVRVFSEEVSSTDPDAALQWANSIGDSSARQQEVTNVLSRWMTSDPTAAAAAVQRSSLSNEEKSRLLSQAQGR